MQSCNVQHLRGRNYRYKPSIKLAWILIYTLLTVSSCFSKTVLVLQRNRGFSPANWLGQRSEWQWLREEWISCFHIYNSVVSWVCALQWVWEGTQAAQNTTLPTSTTELWLWRSAGSSLHLTIPRDPDKQTDRRPTSSGFVCLRWDALVVRLKGKQKPLKHSPKLGWWGWNYYTNTDLRRINPSFFWQMVHPK